jgi:hypothetical protein
MSTTSNVENDICNNEIVVDICNNEIVVPSSNKFSVGQKVIRMHENKEATILTIELQANNIGQENIYHIEYAEGASPGNDGTGYWPESCLEAASDINHQTQVLLLIH